MSTRCYLLHAQKYRETSLLTRLFTVEHGVVSAIAKGALNPKTQSILQPFQELAVKLAGKSNLQNLSQPEIIHYSAALPANTLLCALYCNELVLRLCPEHESHPKVYQAYQHLLEQLRAQENQLAHCLRTFEWLLFRDCGYAVNCSHDNNARPLQKNTLYSLDANWQFVASSHGMYTGEELLSIGRNQFHSSQQAAKKLSRDILTRIIGPAGLKSWKLFA